jgi:hypothetical protein
VDHSCDEFEQIARRGEILRTEVGSGAHGINIEGQDDRDEMGICVEPPEYVIGLKPFDQYIFRTQPEGVRSGPGDLDLTIYSLRKWLRLALAGNPTVLVILFAENILTDARPFAHPLCVDIGNQLQEHPELVLSRQTSQRFIGYMASQRQQLLGLRGKKHTNRPELVEQYGFDTKFAGHMIRLGLQGCELLETGRITLPMPETDRLWIKKLRVGEVSKQDALAHAEELEARLRVLAGTSPLPERPDMDRANEWMINAYLRIWDAWGVLNRLIPQQMMLGAGITEDDLETELADTLHRASPMPPRRLVKRSIVDLDLPEDPQPRG